MKKVILVILLASVALLPVVSAVNFNLVNWFPSSSGQGSSETSNDAPVFTALGNVDRLVFASTEVQRAVRCTSIEAMDNGLQRCVVEAASMSSFGGGVDANSILDVKQVQLINGQTAPANNYVLDIRDTFMAFPVDVGVKFSRFNSILVSDSRLSLTGQPITFSSTAFVNLTNTDILSNSGIVLNTSSSNLLAADLEANSINIYSPFVAVDSASGLDGRLVRLWDHYPNQEARLQGGRISIKSPITAHSRLSVIAETADVFLRRVNSLEVFINSKSVLFGEKFSSGVIGNRSTNFTVIVGEGGFTQESGWPIRGKLISIYSIGDVNLHGDVTSRYDSDSREGGKITLAGQGSVLIDSGSVLNAHYGVPMETAITTSVPSISLSFPNGNVVIRGKLDTYADRMSQPAFNSILIEASNVFMDSNSQSQIDSAHKLTVKAAAITILSTLANTRVRANLADSVPSGQAKMNFTACTSTGIPAAFVVYYHQELSLCGPSRTLNVYGYLANPTGQPRQTGSITVNYVKLAVPRGPYVLNSTGGNITLEQNAVFAGGNGFFRFTIPAVYISPGDYKINMTFSPVDIFNCTLGGCESKEVLITVPPVPGGPRFRVNNLIIMPVIQARDGGLTK